MMTHDATSIWKDFNQELKAFIIKKTKNPADAEDILQDIFIKIIRNIDKIGQAGNLRQYLYGIVRNAVSDHFKKQKPVMTEDEIPEGLTETESESLNIAIAECCIRPFIGQLPDHYRDALLITEFQNISQKELAEKLNISYSGAKSRVQRGKEKLKELILDCCPYQSDVYGNLIDAGNNHCGCT